MSVWREDLCQAGWQDDRRCQPEVHPMGRTPATDPWLPHGIHDSSHGSDQYTKHPMRCGQNCRRVTCQSRIQTMNTWIALATTIFLQGWKADLLSRAGKTVLVRFVMTSMIIYQAIAIDLLPWALKVMDKIPQGFLWRGRKMQKGVLSVSLAKGYLIPWGWVV